MKLIKQNLAIALLAFFLLSGWTMPALAHERMSANGNFTVVLDFATLTLTPQGHKCQLAAQNKLIFSGSLDGEASGSITVLVAATCEQVATNPPGTFADRFESQLLFSGTLDGAPLSSQMVYKGTSAAGGTVAGKLKLSGDIHGNLEVTAVAGQGGTYVGNLK